MTDLALLDFKSSLSYNKGVATIRYIFLFFQGYSRRFWPYPYLSFISDPTVSVRFQLYFSLKPYLLTLDKEFLLQIQEKRSPAYNFCVKFTCFWVQKCLHVTITCDMLENEWSLISISSTENIYRLYILYVLYILVTCMYKLVV